MSGQNGQRVPPGPVTTEEASPDGFEERLGARIQQLEPGAGSLLVVRLPEEPVMSVSAADQVTEALKSAKALLRGGDLLGRHGKNSLCVFLDHVDREIAEKVCVRLHNWMQSFQPEVGTAVYPEDGSEPAELIAIAESNAY